MEGTTGAAAEFVQEAVVSDSLVQFKATLQAAVKEVQVDVKAFKQRVEQKIEELHVSNGPLAGAVTRLREENLQLRAKLEDLSRLVEGLTGMNIDQSPAEGGRKNTENGHMQIREADHSGGSESSQSAYFDASGSSGGSSHAPAAGAPNNTPAPPPWRSKRHAEVNVSILFNKVYGSATVRVL